MNRNGKSLVDSLSENPAEDRVQFNGQYIHDDKEVPIKPLIVLEGTINGKNVRMLKDDGCNTNLVSKEFLKRNRRLFKVISTITSIQHSMQGSGERASEMILSGTIQIGSHVYTSNFLVGSCRYDVLLGMPWHVANNPQIDYPNRRVLVGNEDLFGTLDSEKSPEVDEIQVTNLSVKKFRQIIRKRSENVEVYQVITREVKPDLENVKSDKSNRKLDGILQKYKEVFRSELPDGLPPKRLVDHEIEVEEGVKPPHRPLYQLSPAELKACKEYVESLLKKGKIRRSKSPYGAPLFFVKEADKLRGVVDYRALNRITKKNNTPIPRSDEMFDRIGGAVFFSKIDLKTGFHQIRVKECDIEKNSL